MKFQPVSELQVLLKFSEQDIVNIGRLAIRDRKVYFQYEDAFLGSDLELSPLKLPLQPGLQTFESSLFEGLPGLFYDSLPDGWGRLLLDRMMRMQAVLPQQLSALDRLAFVGKRGMGALVYQPAFKVEKKANEVDITQLARNVQLVLNGESSDVLFELLVLNGSSAGARPKAMIGVNADKATIIHGVYDLSDNFEHWIVKFPNTTDGVDAGAIEYVYALMAKQAGLEMTATHLFQNDKGAGFFATQRFDRIKNNRLHTHSAGGLLHSDYRTPILDYEDLITLTSVLTRDFREVIKLFQLAVFNVLSHNREDHAKNFSFIMGTFGEWKLSPAYDLTFSSGPNGEQSTMVMGEGLNPSTDDLIKLGKLAQIKPKEIKQIIEHTQDALSQWPFLAKHYGVSRLNQQLIAGKIN